MSKSTNMNVLLFLGVLNLILAVLNITMFMYTGSLFNLGVAGLNIVSGGFSLWTREYIRA